MFSSLTAEESLWDPLGSHWLWNPAGSSLSTSPSKLKKHQPAPEQDCVQCQHWWAGLKGRLPQGLLLPAISLLVRWKDRDKKFFCTQDNFFPKNSRENVSELSRTVKQSGQQNQVWTLYFRAPVPWIGLKRCCPQGRGYPNSSHLTRTFPCLRNGYRTIWITLPVSCGNGWQQSRPTVSHQSVEKKWRLSAPSQMGHLCPPLWS